ncbi:MAG TPA: JAB domain-containing protein [Polyangium sp.]|nr:JAB domain-containing protein [Polyangium sp.]
MSNPAPPVSARSAPDPVLQRLSRINESRADGLPDWAPTATHKFKPSPSLRTRRPKIQRLPLPAPLAPESLATEPPHASDVVAMDDVALLSAVTGCSRETATKWIAGAGSLARLSRFGIDDLVQMAGISPSEATRVLAACELGRRGLLRESRPNGPLHGAAEIARWFKLRIGGQFIQEIWVVGINSSNNIHGVCRISHADVHGGTLDPSIFIATAARMHVKTMALVHNHPSGDVTALPDDIRLALSVHRAALSARLKLADFIIVGPKSVYSSMAEQGTLPGLL